MTTTGKKLAALQAVYRLQADFGAGHRLACTPGCDICCTANVTLTTLEGLLLAETLTAGQWDRLAAAPAGGLRPESSINHMAAMCLAGQQPPEEPAAPPTQRCSLLADHHCPVYALRPFACRSMASHRTCRPGGSAEMNPTLLSASEVCLQVIEHLDAGGCTGNLVDVLAALKTPRERQRYREGRLDCRGCGLAPNRSLPALMIPPDQRTALEPLVRRLGGIVASLGG